MRGYRLKRHCREKWQNVVPKLDVGRSAWRVILRKK